jgi:hypothetical protein
MYYNDVNRYVGCFYLILQNKSIIKNFNFIQDQDIDIDLKENSLHLGFENTEI